MSVLPELFFLSLILNIDAKREEEYDSGEHKSVPASIRIQI